MTAGTVQTLEQKVNLSKGVISEALARFNDKVAIAWTGGKDSTTVLNLLREVTGGVVPIPVLFIDTGVHFPEIYHFRDYLAHAWGLQLYIESNEAVLKIIKVAADRLECCQKLKVEVLKTSIQKYGWEALITGMRWDEQPDRSGEDYFSPRKSPDHQRVHPILHFTELDIWQYIKERGIPYCNLYRQGYRSLDCKPCTGLVEAGAHERSGRALEKEAIMKRLRSMGYF